MKKIVSIMLLSAVLFSISLNAQKQKAPVKKKAKTEKTCTAEEKKSCNKEAKGEKRGGCCAVKKEEKK